MIDQGPVKLPSLVYKISVKSSFHQGQLKTLLSPMMYRVFVPINSLWPLLIVFLCYFMTLKGSQNKRGKMNTYSYSCLYISLGKWVASLSQ